MTQRVTQKVTHPQSVSKMLNVLCILADHIATSQFATIKSQAAGVYMIWKKHKEDWDLHGNWLPSVLPSTHRLHLYPSI